MDLNLIHLFVEIVEARSFTAAAQKLGMTRSNLSNRLKVLERETGAQLLRRSTRSLELTQAGETLFRGDTWHPGVHHHDARHEPDDEDETAGDAEPAVAEIQPPLQSPCDTHRQNLTL